MRTLLFSLIFLGLGAVVPAVPDAETTKPEFFLGGIQVNEPDHLEWMQALKTHGMNTVSVTVYAKQGNWNTDHFWYEEEEPYVLREIRAAHQSKLKVVLIPRVALDHAYPANAHLWHGMIMPSTDAQVVSWFNQYRAFLLKWAEIARDEGVDLMAVGSELKALSRTRMSSPAELKKEKVAFQHWYAGLPERVAQARGDAAQKEVFLNEMTARSRAYLEWAQQLTRRDPQAFERRRQLLERLWQETITAVREVYPGPLTYAANFDSYHQSGLWKHLDVMGINAYFQHRKTFDRPSEAVLREELKRSWKRIFSEIREVQQEMEVPGMPVLFTEIGYTGRLHASVEPWSYRSLSVVETEGDLRLVNWEQLPQDPRERVASLETLHQTVQLPENQFFRGLLYWKFSTREYHRDVEPFMIHVGRDSQDPALRALKKWFPDRSPPDPEG